MKIIKSIKERMKGGGNKPLRNRIKLAVVGMTSSGKSYFLEDFIVSLEDLAFSREDMLIPGYMYTGEFSSSRRINDGIKKTERTRANHFIGKYKNEDDSFVLEFVDIPGESVTDETISVFKTIVKSLYFKNSPFFSCEYWFDGDKEIKVLEYPISNGNREQQHTNNTGFSLNNNLPKIGNTQDDRIEIYEETDVVRNRLANLGFKKRDEITMVSGREVLENFFDYYIDTVLNAIYDGWEKLNPEVPARFSYDSDTFKNQFKADYKKDFHYLMFCMKATDIVICDKMTLPDGVVDKTELPCTFAEMIRNLQNLKETPQLFNNEARWYMAMKGVDAILKPNKIINNLLRDQEIDYDFVYSFAITILGIKLSRKTDKAKKKYVENYIVKTNSNNNKIEIAHLSSLGLNKEDAESLLDIISSLRVHDILEENGFNVVYTLQEKDLYDDCQTNYDKLYKHVKQCIDCFLRLSSAPPHSEHYKSLLFPPHFFFVGTPIDKEYNKYGHSEGHSELFKGKAKIPSERMCFGTRQLAKDILLRHKNIECSNDAIGELLNYFFGKE